MGIYLTLLLAVRLVSASADMIDQDSVTLDSVNIEQKTADILATLTLEQKIGQMLMYGFKGKDVDEDIIPLIKKYKPGGFVIFSHNVDNEEQIVRLNKAIQAYSKRNLKLPAFIAIDQEGGRVLRIKDFVTVLPGNMNLGAARSPALSFLAGKLTAIDLEMLGINMNFAPVVDVNMSSGNDVIGVRSFGGNADNVAELGASYITGIQSRRVIATAKHYPGHGNTKGDSHFQVIKIDKDINELRDIDLKPFVEAVRAGVDAIMTAHISVPKVDTSGLPATLSHKLITDILRKEMGFNGLVITDDMEMRSITKDLTIGQAAVEAVLAGCDMITIVWTEKSKNDVYNSLLSAVKKGVIKEDRINESVKRIISAKLKRKLFDTTLDPDIDEVRRVVGNSLHQQISRLIAQKSITLVRNLDNIIPVDKNKKFAVIGSFEYLSSELDSMGIKNSLIKINIKMTPQQRKNSLARILKNDSKVDAYIIAVVDESQAKLANALKRKTKKHVIVASLDSPYMYTTVKNADAYICAYSFRSQAIKALAKVITGESGATGQLPVEIEN